MKKMNEEPNIMFSRALTANGTEPLYLQLFNHLKNLIDSGELQPLDQIPPEIELSKQFKISRITVRKAIAELVDCGLLTRVQGMGTFVAKPKIERALVNVSSFTERMQARGMRAGAKALGVEIEPATQKLSKLLGIREGSDVVRLERIRLINQEPVSFETSYLAREFCPGIENENLDDHSLYQILDSKYQLRPGFSNKTLEIAYANSKEGKILGVPKGFPLFLMTALVYSEDHRVMEYVKIILRGDRFRFQM